MATYAILGATGKVGFATCSALCEAGVSVHAIVHDASKAERLRSIGCDITVADIHDIESLAKIFRQADAIQVVLPLNPVAVDPASDMRNAIDTLARALEITRPKRLLVISDYGAHVSHDIGMPSIFHALESRLSQLDGHKLFLRSAEHMDNWIRTIPVAKASGKLQAFCNLDTLSPTVSASDVGSISASLLMLPSVEGNVTEIFHVEGPRRYSARDVAGALSALLDRTIIAEQVPRQHWEGLFHKQMGPSLGELMIRTSNAQDQGGLVDIEPGSTKLRRGTTELQEVLKAYLSS